MGYSFKTQDLCTLRLTSNRVVSDFPRQMETYPSISEAYWRQTESYPSQTESYPSRIEVHNYKPSSSFDLAIDNKDSDSGNQWRGYAGY